MSQVAFPGLIAFNRKTLRAPDNPLDRSTIVSIYPREIVEVKHTIQPGRFTIPAGSITAPSILMVGPSSWWKEIDEDQPLLEIPTSSILIADSIVKDYCEGRLGCNMSDKMPGLFFIPGKVTLSELMSTYKSELLKADTKQKEWFKELVVMADSLWSRSQGNPLAISDDMRLAARELGQTTREWLQDFHLTESVRCIACGSMRNPLYPVCPTCKAVVDPDKAKGIKFAD